jgi:uncharacterized protein (TIGR02231 family)
MTVLNGQTEKTISQSSIKGVTVFLNGAVINRSATANLEAGITKLTIENLSPYINPNSINVNGTGEVTLLSVQHQQNYLKDGKPTAEVKMLQDSLDDLNEKMLPLQNSKYVYDQTEQMLLANKQLGGKEGVSPDDLDNFVDVFAERLSKVKELQSAEIKKINKLNLEITLISNQLAAINTGNKKVTGTIVLLVAAKTKQSVSFDFSYKVDNASWSPLYDVRANDFNAPLTLTYKANVRQSTGEEWSKVKLKLSTGNPTENGNIPELNPQYIDFLNTQLNPVMVKGARNDAGTYQIDQKATQLNEVVITNAPQTYKWTSSAVTQSENQLSTDFDIAIPYSISSDGKEQLVEISNTTLTANYSYTAIPKLDKDVFLTAYVNNWEDLNLLSGNASIYFQNAFVGNSYINTDTEDSLLFSLGRDKRIIVNREKLKELSSKQFLGGAITKTYTFEIAIKNTKKESVTVTVEDQLPIAQNTAIEVKLIESDGATLDAENGKLTWTIYATAGETVKKKFSYSVKYPKGKVINGM